MKIQQPAPLGAGNAFLRQLPFLLVFLLFSCLQLQAQVPPTQQDPDDPLLVQQDSTGQAPDSTRKRKDVKIKTDLLDPEALMDGRSGRSELRYRIEDIMYPDFLERQDGFSYTLGQWAKPYMRWRMGADASAFSTGNYINPLTGQENVYFLDPIRGMHYFDTRTPFVNAYYAQTKGQSLQMLADISHNIHPLVNVSLQYQSRSTDGVYSQSVNDHKALGASANFHTLNERYQAFGHFLFQGHNDKLHGGVVLIQPDSLLFQQGNQPVSLEDAVLRQFSQATAFRHFFRLTKDTVDAKHSFWLYNGGSLDYFLNQYIDTTIAADINDTLFPVYPTLGDSSFFYERLHYRRLRFDGGISYKLDGSRLKSRQRFELGQDLLFYDKNLGDTLLHRNHLLWKGGLLLDPNPFALEGSWTYRQSLSNLFKPETLVEVEAALKFPKWRVDYSRKVSGPPLNASDSTFVTKTSRLFSINAGLMINDRNPSMQQTYGSGWRGNRFTANPGFNNRRVEHYRLGITMQGRDKWLTVGEQKGRSVSLTAFNTRNFGMIYIGGPDSLKQFARDSYIAYQGLELKFRANLGPIYLETSTVGQNFSSNDTLLRNLFEEFQPRLYTKTSLFYDNKNLKIASILRTGVDFYYSFGYKPPLFDPASQMFYPQVLMQQKPYPRLDFFFATQVKRAYIFVRVINVLEGVTTDGYFSTLGYPMNVRQVMLGLNWSFFD